jgi:hypothetical protein
VTSDPPGADGRTRPPLATAQDQSYLPRRHSEGRLRQPATDRSNPCPPVAPVG